MEEILDHGNDSLNNLMEKPSTDESSRLMEQENEWRELMGRDLLLKSLHQSLVASSDGTTNENILVQPQDTVLVDFTGYFCDDSTKTALFLKKDDTCSLFMNVDGLSNAMENVQRYFQKHEVPIFHTAQDVWCVIGEKDLIPALEMGIRFMQLNETAIIFSHSKYAYGMSNRSYKYILPGTTKSSTSDSITIQESLPVTYTLPSEANVVYIVTLKQIAHADLLGQSSFQVKLCQSKKLLANDVFQYDINDNIQNSFAKHRAIHIYQRAADMLESVLIAHSGDLSETEVSEARNCRIDCLNNIVAVYMKCQLYHAAKESCVQVLQVDPHNIKALLRAAKAALYDPASSYEEVKAAIQAVEDEMQPSPEADGDIQNSSSDSTIRKDLERLRREFQSHQRKYQRQQREKYSRMANQIVKENKDDTGNINRDLDEKSSSSWISFARLHTYLTKVLPPWSLMLLPYAFQVLLFIGMLCYYFYYSTQQSSREANSEL